MRYDNREIEVIVDIKVDELFQQTNLGRDAASKVVAQVKIGELGELANCGWDWPFKHVGIEIEA